MPNPLDPITVTVPAPVATRFMTTREDTTGPWMLRAKVRVLNKTKRETETATWPATTTPSLVFERTVVDDVQTVVARLVPKIRELEEGSDEVGSLAEPRIVTESDPVDGELVGIRLETMCALSS